MKDNLHNQTEILFELKTTGAANFYIALYRFLVLLFCVLLFNTFTNAQNVGIAGDKQGLYFSKKTYSPKQTPPKFADIKDKLPAPIYNDNPDLVKMYWRAWEIAGDNFYEPNAQNGFVSPYIDATFNGNIFFWDTAFMTMFLNYADDLTPGISSLDNFYAKQHEDGEICREISRDKGEDFWLNKGEKVLYSDWGWNFKVEELPSDKGALLIYKGRETPVPAPVLSLDALNHPIAAWAELESYKMTGDRARLKEVYPPLVKYYEALQKYLLQGNGLYITDWASLDNSPRNPFMHNGGTGADISAEMVLYAQNLSEIAKLIGKNADAKKYDREAKELAKLINQKMWNADKKFYFDLSLDGEQIKIKTIAGFWVLLARVADKNQAKALSDELNNPATFKRPHQVPTLAANEKKYDVLGDQWRGGVWSPTNTMVVKGLENYGYTEQAREIALNNLENALKVFKKDGYIWENYSPEQERGGNSSQTDFIGWSGITPIKFFIEYAIGLKADAPKNELTWDLRPGKRKGCERFRFNKHIVSLIAEPQTADSRTMKVHIESDGEFRLRIKGKSFQIKKGTQDLIVKI